MISIDDAIKDLNKKNVSIAEFDDNGNLVHESDVSIAVTAGEIVIMLENLKRYENIVQQYKNANKQNVNWGKLIENKKEQIIDMLKMAHLAALNNRDTKYLVTIDTDSTINLVQLSNDNEINYKLTTETLGLRSFSYSGKLPYTPDFNKEQHKKFCTNINKVYESIVRFW